MTPANTSSALPEFKLSGDFRTNLQQFFNGDTIDHARQELDQLRDTLITESYGDLEREEKWLLIDFVRRVGNLIETAHTMYTTCA